MELEVEWAKVKAQQAKEPLPALTMNAMAKVLKVLQGLLLNERETNAQLFGVKRGSQRKRGQAKHETAKAMRTQMPDLFTRKDTRVNRVK